MMAAMGRTGTSAACALLVVILAVLGAAVGVHGRDYAGYSLFKVATEDPQHVLALLDRFDVWGRAPNGAYDVFAPKAEFLQFSQTNALSFEEVKGDVMDAVRKEQARLAQPKKAEWFEEYHNFNDTRSWYEDLASTYSQIATFVPSVGKTWEGRDIFAFRVTANRTTERKKIWIQCNIHAREWITSATCQFFVNQILTRYGSDAQVTELLEKIEFIFIPIVNPDGYSYTWTNDRLWRKNRRNNGLSYGVDLNRNYDQQWGGIGSSTSPTSETYCGPSAASEPEVQALAAYYNKEASSIIGAIDVHSYSQLILRPYTHTDVASRDEANLRKVSEEMASIIRAVHGTRFTPGVWFSGLYPSSGVAQDYYYVRGSFALTVELRPDSSFPGFVLPPDEIIPSGEELTPALLHFATFTLANKN